MTSPYDAFVTHIDLPAAVLALEVRALARVIGRDAARNDFPDMTDRELAQAVIKEAAAITLDRMDEIG